MRNPKRIWKSNRRRILRKTAQESTKKLPLEMTKRNRILQRNIAYLVFPKKKAPLLPARAQVPGLFLVPVCLSRSEGGVKVGSLLWKKKSKKGHDTDDENDKKCHNTASRIPSRKYVENRVVGPELAVFRMFSFSFWAREARPIFMASHHTKILWV